MATRSFVDEKTGALTLVPRDVDRASTPYLGSEMGHDSFHIELFKLGGITNSRGLGAEVKAMQFQLDFGQKIGVSDYESDYLRDLIKNPEQLKPFIESPVQ